MAADMVRVSWRNNATHTGGDWKTTPMPATRASVLRAHSHGYAHSYRTLGASTIQLSTQQRQGSLLTSFGRALPPKEAVSSVRMVSSPRRATQRERRGGATTDRTGRRGGRGHRALPPGGSASARDRSGHVSPRKNTKLATLRHNVNKVKVGVRLARSMRDSTDGMLRSTDSLGPTEEDEEDDDASSQRSTESDEPHEHEVPNCRGTTPDIHVMLGPQLSRLGGMGGGFAFSPAAFPRNWGPRGTDDLRARPPTTSSGRHAARPGQDPWPEQGLSPGPGLTVADAWGTPANSLRDDRNFQPRAGSSAGGSTRATSAMDDIARLRDRLRSANGESRDGNHKQASVLFQESLASINSQHGLAHHITPRAHSNLQALRANSAVRVGDLSTARKAASQSVQLDKTNPRAFYTLAKSEKVAGNLGSSARAIHAALQREPNHKEYTQVADEAHDHIRFGRFYRNELNKRNVRYRRRSDDARTPTPEPPKTPEPQPQELDDAWKFLDLYDIFEGQHELREAINKVLDEGAVDNDGDGEGDGVVSAKDKFAIVQFLQRGSFTKKQIKHIEAVLDTAGQTLNPPAKKLLEELLPPDVAEDHANIIKELDEKQGFIKTVFRYYAVEGAVGMSEIDTMSKNALTELCKECKIKLGNKTEIDRVFIRANRDNSDAILDAGKIKGASAEKVSDKALLLYLQPGREDWHREEPLDSKHMNVPEFVASLIRLATLKYPGMPSICARFNQLFQDHIADNACCSPNADAVSEVLKSAQVVAVFLEKEPELDHKFNELRMADNEDNHDEFQNATVNMDAYMNFLLSANLIGKKFTAKDARRIFVKVNLDDELFQNTAENEFDSADGLAIAEFKECLVRITVELQQEALGGTEGGFDGATVNFSLDPDVLAPLLSALVEKTCDALGKKKKKKKGQNLPEKAGAN